MIHTELLMSDQYWIKTQMAEISAYRKWRVNTSAGIFSFGQSVTLLAMVHLLTTYRYAQPISIDLHIVESALIYHFLRSSQTPARHHST